MASPISDVPPRSRMVCGFPTASKTTCTPHLEQLQTSGHVRCEGAVGIDLAAHRDPLVDAWVHGVEHLGGGAIVLGGVEPATELEHSLVQSVQQFVEPGPDREVDAYIPTGDGKAQRRLISGAEELEHVEERHVAAGLNVDQDLLELVHRFDGYHELVLPESVRPVRPVPLSDHVERVIELRQVLDLATVRLAHS